MPIPSCERNWPLWHSAHAVLHRGAARVLGPNLAAVVPARARTHNHPRFQLSLALPRRLAAAYGSPPARGRQRRVIASHLLPRGRTEPRGDSSSAHLALGEIGGCVVGRAVEPMLLLAGLERGLDLSDELARGSRGELDRDTFAPSISFIDEIDVESVIERRVIGMVVVDV